MNGLYLEKCRNNLPPYYQRCENIHHFRDSYCVKSIIDKDIGTIMNSIMNHKATMISPTHNLANKRSDKLRHKGYEIVQSQQLVPDVTANAIDKPPNFRLIYVDDAIDEIEIDEN